jgi:hypothetical protein
VWDRKRAHWDDMEQMGRVRGAGGKKKKKQKKRRATAKSSRSVRGGGGRVTTTAAATNGGARRSAQVGAGSTTETLKVSGRWRRARERCVCRRWESSAAVELGER